MKTIKIKKQNISKNNGLRYHQPKKMNNKRRSISVAEKNVSNVSDLKKNISFDNSLELDYLNFSKIDLFKLNQSFEDDIFTPNNNKKRKNRIVEDRYADSVSTMNGNSTIIKNYVEDSFESHKFETKEKEQIMNTPSTMCNYYDQSTNKKNTMNNPSSKYSNKFNDQIKKNLSQYYNKNLEENENYNPNEKNNKNKNEYAFSIKCPDILLNNEKPSTKYLKQNLKSNSILHNNNNKFSKITNIDKIFKSKETKASNSQNKINKISKTNKNDFNINKNYSKSNEKFQYKISNKSSLKNTKDEIKMNNINISNKEKISMKTIKGKNQKQKPLNLYYNQNKYNAYFITPRSINKRKSSTKSTKVNINTGSIIKNKSFNVNKNNKNNNIKNNLIYMNNKETNNPNFSNNKMIKELINDFGDNTKKINKSTPKNKIKINKEISSSKKDFIKVNLKNSTKSSSNLASTQKNFFIKNKNQIFYPYNQANNYQNSKLKSEIKNSFNIYKNISNKNDKNMMFSPMNKNPSSINYEAQKTLTEQNVFVNKLQEATPKNYRVQKFDSVPFTAMVKKIFVGSSKKDNLIKLDSSLKKKQYHKTKTEQMKCIFKPKTQTDLKNYEQIFGLGGGDYGNDKHVKQKLLDRMNKATNNWQYIFMGNKNKKIKEEKNLNKEKGYIDYFNNNENIISDGSEKEDED